jgi:hypothetical protein
MAACRKLCIPNAFWEMTSIDFSFIIVVARLFVGIRHRSIPLESEPRLGVS